MLFRKNLRPYSIVCRGDSLTNGTGATTTETKWATKLARDYPPAGRHVWNSGIGGNTSTQIKDRMVANDAYIHSINTIWAGRNDYYVSAQTVKDNIDLMVQHLATDKFLILSIVNGEYPSEYKNASGWNTITSINNDLSIKYPNNYVDIRTILVNSYDPNTAQDVIDFAHDIVPSTLRYDEVHHNDAGQDIVYRTVKNELVKRGWWDLLR